MFLCHLELTERIGAWNRLWKKAKRNLASKGGPVMQMKLLRQQPSERTARCQTLSQSFLNTDKVGASEKLFASVLQFTFFSSTDANRLHQRQIWGLLLFISPLNNHLKVCQRHIYTGKIFQFSSRCCLSEDVIRPILFLIDTLHGHLHIYPFVFQVKV